VCGERIRVHPVLRSFQQRPGARSARENAPGMIRACDLCLPQATAADAEA
jgi:hypothetical protein